MPMLDVFNTDAFGLISLTESINKLPYQPKRIAKMGLFSEKGISTTTATIEEKGGVLAMLPSKRRGEPGTQRQAQGRKQRSLLIPHIPYDDSVLAGDVQDVRKFGTEDQLESVSAVVNDHLQDMRQSHETTLEWLRMGAIKGLVVDGDGSTTLYNLDTEFETTPPTAIDFVLGTTTTDVGGKCIEVKEAIETALGDAEYDHVHGFCGATFFKAFVAHPEVKYAYQYFQEGKMLRDDPRAGFEYKGITFEVYRGSIGGTAFAVTGDCRFFPVGVPDLFVTYFAPADFVETVNTIGLPVYAKQAVMKFDRGIEIHTQSNPLPLCTRPGVLIRGYTS